mmetsp:Transcript_168169/g.322904  ORF Transcript_168169/g.322904 Transcript_168169/m.322904 type:complete len:163 (+) Transcript_168169:127-615(+)
MAVDDQLTALNDKLAGSHEARGSRGGLGRVKGPKPFTVVESPKWPAAGDDLLYRRFTRGPTLGGNIQEASKAEAARDTKAADEDAEAWQAEIKEVLNGAGGEIPWPALQNEVVSRWRRKRCSSGGKSTDEALWPIMALAHIPEACLSREDSLVRLPAPKKRR